MSKPPSKAEAKAAAAKAASVAAARRNVVLREQIIAKYGQVKR